jgi:hypothetical protein
VQLVFRESFSTLPICCFKWNAGKACFVSFGLRVNAQNNKLPEDRGCDEIFVEAFGTALFIYVLTP